MSQIKPPLPAKFGALGWLSVVGLLIGALCHLLWLTSLRALSLDEFVHSHAAWLWHQGSRPYLEFWSHDSGGLWQLLSVAHDFSDSARQFVVRCRQLLCLGWLVQLWLLWRLAAHWLNAKWALFAPLTALLLQPWLDTAIEIRGEPLAWTLLLSGVWLVQSVDPQGKGIRSALAGFAIVTASWFSLYVGACGALWVTLLIVDAKVRSDDRATLVDLSLLLSAVTMTGCVWIGFLWSTGLLGGFWQSAVLPIIHGGLSTPRTASKALMTEVVWPNLATFVAAGLGALSMIRQALRAEVDAARYFMAAVVIMTLTSWSMSWDSSLDSGMGSWILCALWAPLGLRWAWRGGMASERWHQVAVPIWLLVTVTQLALHQDNRPDKDLERQLKTLDQIEGLTLSTDLVFASHGQAIARQTIYPLCSNGWRIRQHLNAKLEEKLITSLYENRVSVVLAQPPNQPLRPKLSEFIKRHFVPYNEDILLWGSAVRTRHGGHGKDSILIPKRSTWLIEQINPKQPSTVWVDGEQVRSNSLYLRRGLHQVEVQSGAGVWVLWQPRDGRRWRPETD
ncbi:MAG TPA: hypothetical protein DCQ06_02115 [Myxococcales bacterium]|nr:hypothetical protein [Myxococcales bacterium]HAN30369.1 hypothetical protein [Myxococcales bacterium]